MTHEQRIADLEAVEKTYRRFVRPILIVASTIGLIGCATWLFGVVTGKLPL